MVHVIMDLICKLYKEDCLLPSYWDIHKISRNYEEDCSVRVLGSSRLIENPYPIPTGNVREKGFNGTQKLGMKGSFTKNR